MGTTENEMHRIDVQNRESEKESKDPILMSPVPGCHRSNSSGAAGEATTSQDTTSVSCVLSRRTNTFLLTYSVILTLYISTGLLTHSFVYCTK